MKNKQNLKAPFFFTNLIKFVRGSILMNRIKKARKKADKLSFKKNQKAIVIMFDGKPMVKTKHDLKNMIHSGIIKTDIQTLEQLAIYKTYQS